MKLLHINSYYSNRFFYKNLFDKQLERGFDVEVYVPVHKKFDKKLIDFGKYTRISPIYNQYDRYVFHLKHLKILSDVQKNYNIKTFNLLHAHSLFSNGYIAYKLNQKYEVPYIVAVRNTDLNIFFNKMIHLRNLGINILKNAKGIIFLSPASKFELLDKYIPDRLTEEISSKSVIIPNGIANYWFDNSHLREHAPTNLNSIKLIEVAMINKSKNQLMSAKAAEILIKKGFNVELTLVGEITNKKIFNQLIEKPFVKYEGKVGKERLLEIYRENDIFIMPSLFETFGLVYVEAMSQGLPVLYSKGQGFDGQFNDGLVGYGIQKTNPIDIAEKIQLIAKDFRKFSNNATLNSSKYTWEIIEEKYAEYYNIVRDK